MEEEIKIILASFDDQIARDEKKIIDLEEKIKFCTEHHFEEEVRIARIKLDAIDMTVYRWRNMYKAFNAIINPE